jgi:hypothetical protein
LSGANTWLPSTAAQRPVVAVVIEELLLSDCRHRRRTASGPLADPDANSFHSIEKHHDLMLQKRICDISEGSVVRHAQASFELRNRASTDFGSVGEI